MKRRDAAEALREMLAHAIEASELVEGRSKKDFEGDRVLELALVRLLEIVGQAAARVPDDGRAALPDVPWRAIVGMRNKLIHAYDAIDLDIVWAIIKRDLPGLVATLRAHLDHRAADP